MEPCNSLKSFEVSSKTLKVKRLTAIEYSGLRYKERTWLNGQFQLTTWNVFIEDGPRTNNNLEGWHNKVKKIAGKSHLDIFEMVELYKLQQTSTEVGLRQLMAGGAL